MIFNSTIFILLLPIIFIFYWNSNINSVTKQNLYLLISSLLFYSFGNLKFIYILLFSIGFNYLIGILIYNYLKIRKYILIFGLISNLLILFLYKYFNFFIDIISPITHLFKFQFNYINLLLPIGISFYTFHSLSYIIDIYNNKIKPEFNFITYALYVCFFPLLVAGPIERATNLLPQLLKLRIFNFNLSIIGIRLIIWGFFKKLVIADGLSLSVNEIFLNHHLYSSNILITGAFFFSIQIYCDFSGYTDIAIGTARLFGISIKENFNFPYFSTNISDFWKKWHISLTSFFRDYLYIPLGGSKNTFTTKIRNIFIIFLISALWHGANFTFVFWGFLNAFFFSLTLIKVPLIKNCISKNNTFIIISKTILNFILLSFLWIFFRSTSLSNAFDYIYSIFIQNDNSQLFKNPYNYSSLNLLYFLISIWFIIEILLFNSILKLTYKNLFIEICINTILLLLIFIFTPVNFNTSFIYFNF